jgi:hypothetical protein
VLNVAVVEAEVIPLPEVEAGLKLTVAGPDEFQVKVKLLFPPFQLLVVLVAVKSTVPPTLMVVVLVEGGLIVIVCENKEPVTNSRLIVRPGMSSGLDSFLKITCVKVFMLQAFKKI